MKVLFVGGTGLISSACSELAVARGIELWLLNRAGSPTYQPPQGANTLTGDVHGDERALARLLEGHAFDAVVDWIAFTPEDIERDIRLFSARTRQFVFISSASAYQTPPEHYLITEQTPLVNPFWQYSRDKIACEQRLMDEYGRSRFPITIVRPSHTYGPSQLPFAVGSWQHPYTVLARMKRGDPIIVHGDGTSLWVVTWNADLAVGLVGLLGRDDAVGEAFQMTSDEVLTWNQITAEIGGALGVEPNVVHIPSDLNPRHTMPIRARACSVTRRTASSSTTPRSSASSRNSTARCPSGWACTVPSPGSRQTQPVAPSMSRRSRPGTP